MQLGSAIAQKPPQKPKGFTSKNARWMLSIKLLKKIQALRGNSYQKVWEALILEAQVKMIQTVTLKRNSHHSRIYLMLG